MLVNLINITYCAMKMLPYQDSSFAKYQSESVQEFRFALMKIDFYLLLIFQILSLSSASLLTARIACQLNCLDIKSIAQNAAKYNSVFAPIAALIVR